MSEHSLLINLSALIQKPTGISVYAHNLVPELQALEPTILSSQPFTDTKCLPVSSRLTPEHGFRGHLRRLWWLQSSLPKIYQDLKSRLIFSPLPEAPLYSNCQIVITVHDLIPLRFPRTFSPLTQYFRHFVPHIVRQAVHIICDSDSTARDLEQFYQISRRKITTVPLAYDQDHFTPTEDVDKPIIQQERPYFIYIGRQDSYKNIGRLISAFSMVASRTDTELWVVGPRDNRYSPTLLTQVQELNLAHRVRFLDYVSYSKLPSLLRNALALTFPSLWEGFGLPALEAMACGTPVITSNLSSLPEVVGGAAILINPYKVSELADAMTILAHDNQLRQSLRLKGLEQARQYSWGKTGQQTMNILKQFV